MVKFKHCKLRMELEAQSPLIHFQTNENYNCLTLRASEVKPKLDQFLFRKLKLAYEDKIIYEKYPLIFIDEGLNALNYRMKIEIKGKKTNIIRLNNNKDRWLDYDLYYGNMGKPREEQKQGIISDITLTIFCFIPELRKLIQDYIEEFFIVTNFGTMQNKGFGSFLPKSCYYNNPMNEKQISQIADYLLDDTISMMRGEKKGTKTCYCMKFIDKKNTTSMDKEKIWPEYFKQIKDFYGIMKSGRNFRGFSRSYIYKYMHTKGIDNEKAWMKQKNISPVVNTKGKNYDRRDKNPKYVRAMLGTGAVLSYIAKAGSNDKVPIIITSKDEKVKRVPSPIYFKIVKNVVFIIAREIPEEIYNKKFEFRNKETNKSGCLFTPNEFDIDEFLEKYVNYYNKDLRDDTNIKDIENNKKVVKVKCRNLSE